MQETWINNNSSTCFLTEACRRYSERDKWGSLNSFVLPHHWNDRFKLKQDHDYLKILYERILGDMTVVFNNIFGSNESEHYYRIILGPWLINYLPIVFDRWETLRSTFSSKSSYLTANLIGLRERVPAKDFNSFIDLMQTDLWNYSLYKRIIDFQHADHCEMVDVIYTEKQIKKHQKKEHKVISTVDKLLSIISKDPRIFFYKSYFKASKLGELNLALRQVPRFYSKEFELEIENDFDVNFRKRFKIGLVASCRFEEFLFEVIFADIPLVYIESFREIRNYTSSLPFNPDKIVTANAYWTNDIFKIWAAHKSTSGTALLISCHGGALPPLFNTFEHEEDISNAYITWFRPYHPKHVQLPPNKLVGSKKQKTCGNNCSVIGFESPKYGYRATAGPISNQTLDVFNHTSEFCSALSDQVKERLRIRPYPNLGWETALRYTDKFGSEKIDSRKSYTKFIQESKLIVCTYPQTTFAEALSSGTPTILVFIPRVYELIPESNELLNMLKTVKIVFTDPLEAAIHVNSIWGDIFQWWHNAEVVAAKRKFYETALRLDLEWKKSWVDYLKKGH